MSTFLEDIIPTDWMTNSSLITVIGVGGAGCNAVTHMYNQGIENVNFMVCNTDRQTLDRSSVPNKIQLGSSGLGAGCDPETARKATLESMDRIRDFFDGVADTVRNATGNTTGDGMVFVTAGMGGGTGTGSAPLIAQEAKSRGLLTVGVITLPFTDEGKATRSRAVAGLYEMRKVVDCLIVIDNNKLYDVFGQMNFFETMPKSDEVLTTAVKGIADVTGTHGEINIDFADIRMTMRNSGIALIGIGHGTGPARALDAVEQAFSSPLLNDLDLRTAKSALVNITASDSGEGMRTDEFSQIIDYINEYTGNADNFKRGVVRDRSNGDRIDVTVIATGFDISALPQMYIIDDKDMVELKENDAENIYKSGEPIPAAPLSSGIPVYKPLPNMGKPDLILAEEQGTSYYEVAAYIRRDKRLMNKE